MHGTESLRYAPDYLFLNFVNELRGGKDIGGLVNAAADCFLSSEIGCALKK
jgi:hypothetical protein